MSVSITKFREFAERVDARPQPSDKFTVTLTRAHLEWLREIVRQQVLTEQRQMEYYIRRDAAKHPKRKAIEKFRHRLQMAENFRQAIDKAKRNFNG